MLGNFVMLFVMIFKTYLDFWSRITFIVCLYNQTFMYKMRNNRLNILSVPNELLAFSKTMPNLHYVFYLRADCPYQLSNRYLTVCNMVNDYENNI